MYRYIMKYYKEAELRQPPEAPYSVQYWPDSVTFMNIKGREQKCLKSTIQFDPPTTTTEGVGGEEEEEEEGGGDVKTESTKGKDGEVVGDGERSTLPFRDGIFASRAIRLLEVAAAQVDIPWFLAIGFSLPHEPIRV
jgi:hypothetical protein